MSYTDDAVKAKLSALNETQDSIVTVAQWIMFHRRYAERTAQIWLQRLKDSGAKRLNLVYLANEVVQQSKARKKEDFLNAFSPIITDAIAVAYKSSTAEVQGKLRRVVEVWRQRQIFDMSVQESVEKTVDQMDRERGTRKAPLGGSLFSTSGSGSLPPELASLLPLQSGLSKAIITSDAATTNAKTEYATLIESGQSIPTPPVFAARLNSLLKSLHTASGAVTERIEARRKLVAELHKIIALNDEELEKEEKINAPMREMISVVEDKKEHVEEAIMKGLSAEETAAATGSTTPDTAPPDGLPEDDFARPEIEPLTPPPIESFTPPFIPADGPPIPSLGALDTAPVHPEAATDSHTPTDEPPSGLGAYGTSWDMGSADVRQHSGQPRPRTTNGDVGLHGMSKKRKTSHGDELDAFSNGDAMEGLDADVVGMLG